MRYLVIIILLTITTPAWAAPGDTALQALLNGKTGELAQTACDEGDPSACTYAGLSSTDQTRVTAAMIQIVRDGQARCARDPDGDECRRLMTMDRQATEVLSKKGFHKTQAYLRKIILTR